ncbi:hypothetical protein [Stigmatella aurantiaca]|uniref:Uncharacterized protein n=1 Tax=Stigmatella aurantiaca (strain DW4/3-1) TaxID=378806 RepID=Q08UG5_STIAD|nr:hypothetical protein [Stigmatella aurantiaca]ADO73362.1 uncharacterized protein STAUR_5597 [Stigmatella aurantiaca DW4/3-1]EAU64134.1 hypothetical protein STIAU_5424 [Stigmatella aurantiaca DW4/3-1]
MTSLSLKPFLGAVVLLSAPVSLADSTTTIPAFEAQVATARGAASPGESTVVRAELSQALSLFLSDDGTVDAQERTYLGTRLGDAAFLTGIDASAWQYFTDFYHLNDGATVPAVPHLWWPGSTPEELYGVSGPLADASEIRDGYVEGIANQLTLVHAAYTSFGIDRQPSHFVPIDTNELIAQLSVRYDGQTVSEEEVNGAAAYITWISRNSHLLYKATWFCAHCGGGPGDMGGSIFAAVSTDRRRVRMVRVRTWVE